MSFRCPSCQGFALEITEALELGPDGNSDENMVQTIECTACDFRGLATYEESRRGSLDRESVDHTGWRVTTAVFDRVKQLLVACPAGKPPCRCHAHGWLGTGGWGMITELRRDGVDLGEWFWMERG